MSRGAGRIERIIEAAFASNGDGIFKTDDLVALAYRGLNRIEKKHRVAVSRAARNLFARTGWFAYRQEKRGGQMIYFNRRSVLSYALFRLRADFLNNRFDDDDIRTFLDERLIQHGGHWHRHVETFRAELDGDTERTAALKAETEQRLAELSAGIKAKWKE